MRMGGASLLERILDKVEDPTNLPLELLKDITNDFSEERKIGQGGFGAVYKGVLGERIVAVKRIHMNLYTFDDKLFHREVTSLMKTNHRNVVRFLGVCSHGYQKPIEEDASGKLIWANVLERLLCFEYIRNGSLNQHITDELRGLPWETRFEIIIGICKGLHYLHEKTKIIHMDLKPDNILLDHQDGKYMVPKITDFGLSRPKKNSCTMGICFGTIEYLAPEYRDESKTTTACDIYSLGVIIIELVTGYKDIPHENNVLRRWRHRWKNPPTQLQYQQVTRCIYIAKRCREQKPEARPSISEIVSFLSESEHTFGQISNCFDEDDMLGIKPLELRLLSKLKNKISRPVELINGTQNCIAFNIKLPCSQYNAQPVKGVVQPGTTCVVTITVQAQDGHAYGQAETLIVQSTVVSNDCADEDITEGTFCKVIDEVDFIVVYESMKPQKNCKDGKYTNTPETGQGNLVEFASGNAINKLGSGENAEAISMDISSGAQGQCTELHRLQSFSRLSPTNNKYLAKESDRAVDVARGAMGSLLDKLGKIVTGDYFLDPSIKKDIESFSIKLRNIHLDLPELQNVVRAKVFIDEVREMSYNIEDMVDSFSVRLEPDSNSSGFIEIMHESVKLFENGKTAHHQITDVIRDIKERVQAMVHRKEEYNFSVKYAVTDVTDKAAFSPHMAVHRNRNKVHLIGIEAPRDEVIGLFEEGGDVDKKDLSIVSIVGLGGLGKTTLATAVYEEFKGYTPKAFVSVGQNPDPVAVLKNIIRDCQGLEYNAAKLENLNVVQLINELHDYLQNKRYFIVIDDLWCCQLWDTINSAFPRDKCGSRVITTTRIQEVVGRERWSFENKVYRIKQLSKEDSRSLFFRRTSSLTPWKEEISKDILKKCGGMPLAINCIASHLALHQSEASWEHARKSLVAIKGNDIEKMKQILELSYIHLPDHLKTCLLHVCMYPEDRDINKKDLLRQWVAESFVSTEGGHDAEYVAEEYFHALVDMFMIQPWKIDYYNQEVLSCRIHDIILELMRSKSSKEKFIHVIDGLKDVSGKICRVSVESNDNKDCRILETIHKGSLEHVRSVLLYRGSFVPYFLKYNYVRVLHIVDTKSFQDLDLTSISRLFLLRYLKVKWCIGIGYVLKLPNQIGQLQQLETIYLRGGIPKNYPPDIVDLPCLSHLICHGYRRGILLPDKISKLKSLRTLVGVCVSGSTVENIKGLGELNNLRELHIQEQVIKQGEATSICMEALHSSICKLSASLRILYLRRWSDQTYNIDYRYYWSSSIFPRVSNIRDLDLGFCSFRSCPPWIAQLQNLYKFRIVVREVTDAFSIVGGLPCLAYFEMHTASVAKNEEMVVICGSGGAFRALKELHFYCPKASLTFEAGALPKLEKLDILFRYHMARRFLPVGIQHLPSLTLKEISLGLDEIDLRKRFFDEYDEYDYRYDLHIRRFKIMLTRAFKPHHPTAAIILYFLHDALDEVDDSEDHEGVDAEEDCCSEKDYQDCHSEEDHEVDDDDDDDYSTEEDGDGSYQVSGSQTSAQVQANTRKLIELNERQEDSGRTSMLRSSVHLAVGSEGRPSRHTELENLQPFYVAPRSELFGQGPDWKALELHFPSLPSYLQPRRQPPPSVHLAVGSEGRPSSHTELENLRHFYLEPGSELFYQALDWESLELPFPSNMQPSYLELTQPRMELNQAPNELNDEEADEVAYQVNASQNSARVRASTRQVELIEVHEDFGMMSINTDAPPTLLHLGVALDACTEDLGSLQLSCTGLTNLAVCSSPETLTAEPMANLPVDINNDHLVEQGNNGMLVNSVRPNLDLCQAAPGGLVGIATSPGAAQPQAKPVCVNSSDYIFLDNLMKDSGDSVEGKDDDPRMGADDNDDDDDDIAYLENLLKE